MFRGKMSINVVPFATILVLAVNVNAQVVIGTVTVGNSGNVQVQESVNEGQQPSNVGYPGWTVDPSEPTSADWVTISVQDWWGTSCVPNTSEVWRDGNDIYFELDNASVPPCSSCLQVITCCVNLSESVGRLEPETYTVYEIVDPLCPQSVPRPVLTFTVRPKCTGDLDCDDVADAIDVCNNTPPGTAVDAQGRPLEDIDLDCDADLDDFVLFHQQGFTGLDDYALFQQGFTGSLAPPGVVIDTVPVGNPGNSNDTEGDGYGGVNYAYNIGKYEVTAGQYTEFLNAVAATDTYGLHNENMAHPAADWYGCNIQRSGSSGSYSYSVAVDWADRPVNYVSWGDAARFANWLHNGQPTGTQDLTTTEDGSYYLNGATSDTNLLAITREPDATWVIPSEDEWYKAAYHYNDGVTGNYWGYPTESDTAPTSEAPPGTDMTNGSANYYDGRSFVIGNPYYRTEVGAYDAKPSNSSYGTFDQGGNVWEWNEAEIVGSSRGLRGGSFISFYGFYLHASHRFSYYPTLENGYVGFRVSEVD